MSKYPYEEQDKWWWFFYSPLGLIMGVAILILSITGIFLLIRAPEKNNETSAEVPIISNLPDPYKETSENLDSNIDHQDKEVYKRISSKTSSGEAINNAKTTPVTVFETPIDLDELAEENALPGEKDLNSSESNSEEKFKKISSSIGIILPSEEKGEKNILNAKKVESSESADVAVEKTRSIEKNQITLKAGKYVIRVASLRKESTAQAELKRTLRLLETEAKAVGGAVKKITSTNGNFYVVNVGGFASIDEAERVVNKLNSKGLHAHIQKVK
jgi:cell division septation protein DedD